MFNKHIVYSYTTKNSSFLKMKMGRYIIKGDATKLINHNVQDISDDYR